MSFTALQIEYQQISMITNLGHLTDKTHLNDIFIFTKATIVVTNGFCFYDKWITILNMDNWETLALI